MYAYAHQHTHTRQGTHILFYIVSYTCKNCTYLQIQLPVHHTMFYTGQRGLSFGCLDYDFVVFVSPRLQVAMMESRISRLSNEVMESLSRPSQAAPGDGDAMAPAAAAPATPNAPATPATTHTLSTRSAAERSSRKAPWTQRDFEFKSCLIKMLRLT